MTNKIVIDLNSPAGNAFALIGLATKLGKASGMSKKETNKLRKDMMSSDYDNVVKVIEDTFPELVQLIRG